MAIYAQLGFKRRGRFAAETLPFLTGRHVFRPAKANQHDAGRHLTSIVFK